MYDFTQMDTLIIYSIVDNMIETIFPFSAACDLAPASWEEFSELQSALGVQLLDPIQRLFISNAHSTTRAMVVSVFSFILYGQSTRPVKDANGPFLSYVREDDDYETLCRRLATGLSS